jgi:hypothetical protein
MDKLTPRQQFKVGFIMQCIQEGDTTPEAIEKRANAILGMEKEAVLGKLVDLGKELGGTALSWMIPLGLAAPPIAGAGLGYAAARATDVDDTDVEEARQQELIEEYRRQSAKIKRRKLFAEMRRNSAGVPG